MPTNPAFAGLPEPPQIPSGREIYDMLMGQIEPELTTEGVSLLPQKPPKLLREQPRHPPFPIF